MSKTEKKQIGKCYECKNFINTDCSKNRIPKIGTVDIIPKIGDERENTVHTFTQEIFVKMIQETRFCIDFEESLP